MAAQTYKKPAFVIGNTVVIFKRQHVYEVVGEQPLSKTKVPCWYLSKKDLKASSCDSYPKRTKMIGSSNYGDLRILKLRILGTEEIEQAEDALCEPYLDTEMLELIRIVDINHSTQRYDISKMWILEHIDAERNRKKALGLVHTGKD